MRLQPFARLPTDFVREQVLCKFVGPSGVSEMKTLLGVVIVRGILESQQQRPSTAIPMTLDQLTKAAHMSRNQAHAALAGLVQKGMLRLAERPRGRDLPPRTPVYEFAGREDRYFPVPYLYLEATGFLASLRLRNASALAALKLYILLGAFRDRGSGTSRIGYARMEHYAGISREEIRLGLRILERRELVRVLDGPIEPPLVTAEPSQEQTPGPRYEILGLRLGPGELADAAPGLAAPALAKDT